MEKLETKIYTKEETIHHFYCDDCNKYLGKTEEYDDGYYSKLGEFKVSFRITGNPLTIKKYLCDECKKKFLEKIENSLKELGFE